MSFEDEVQRELVALNEVGRLRATRPWAGPSRVYPVGQGGAQITSFCSNDYLGLATHPAVRAAAVAAVTRSGFGSGASRLVSGEAPEHRALERGLADFLAAPEALLFPTGYQANLGVITALASPADLIVSDAANHASLIDGCRLSRARIIVYPHLDARAAQIALQTSGQFRRRFLLTESLFSMDGDRAPLAELAVAARTCGGIFIVDEAHALGVCGPRGQGLAAEANVRTEVLIATLGKALGALGGLAIGSASVRHLLINRARQFIYTTAPPPAVAAAASTALAIVQGEEGSSLRARAAERAAQLRAGMTALGLSVPGRDLIIPLVLGSEERALTASRVLEAASFLVPAIRPPTVPPGRSRLRFTVSAAHTSADIEALLKVMAAHPAVFQASQ